ncbi:MAG TPA: transglycosylase domain-containing protein [Albitalea sp.]
MNWKLPAWARRPVDAEGRVLWPAMARRVVLWFALALAVLLLALLALVMALLPKTPGVEQLRELQAARPSVLVSADGKPLTSFTRAQQERVPLAKVSPHVVAALLATEDQRFYDHRGVDVYRTAGAAFRTLTGQTQGGSTLTQQLARNLFPEEIGRSRTLTRKLKELIAALRIERTYSKQQILEIYLNSAPFLYNVVGIEMAARTYYDKTAAELDELESATLIGMLKGTDYYNPIRHPERAKERRNVVLAQMVKRNALSEDKFQALRSRPLTVQLNRQPEILGEAPHFAVQMRKWLIDWADEHGYNVYTDGLIVHTTIDSRLQEAATRAVARQAEALQAVADVEWSAPGLRVQSASTASYVKARDRVDPFAHFWNKRRDLVGLFLRETPEYKEALKAHGSQGDRAAEEAALKALRADSELMARVKRDKTRLEAGFVAMDPASGEVKAWVGSRDFKVDQYDHVAQAERQPGSTFKPFVYGAALEGGIGQERVYVDQPVEIALSDGTLWKPTDMSGASGMPMTLRDGLVYSKNTITAQVAQEVGIPRVVSFARSLGVDQSKLDPVPSLALGTSPVTLLEMVTAYSTISQQGTYHKPVTIKRITDRHGRVLAEFGGETRRAMSSDAARDLIDMMRGVVQVGTGTAIRSRFGVSGDVAGKTGTSQNNADGWFILMHADLVAGAWVGFNDSRVAMRSDHWGQGGHNAILLVGDFYKSALKDGLISAKAKLPPARRPPPAPAVLPQPDSWLLETDRERMDREQREQDQVGAITHSGDIVVHNDANGSIVIGDKASITLSRPATDREPPKTSEELDRMLRAMGRDPRTGEPGGSLSASGTAYPAALSGEVGEVGEAGDYGTAAPVQ